jgi:hypothetical protein
MDQQLEAELRLVARLRGKLWVRRVLAVMWLVLAVASLAVMFGCWLFGWPTHLAALGVLVVAMIVALRVMLLGRRLDRDLRAAARGVEQRFSELDNRLLAAIEQSEGWPPGRYGYLQEQVVGEAVVHSKFNAWDDTVPHATLSRWRLASWLSFAVLVVTTAVLFELPMVTKSLGVAPPGILRHDLKQFQVTVEPGDTTIERGTDLLVLARFSGPLPSNVSVAFGPTADAMQRVAMPKSLDDPIFGGRIAAVPADLVYRVEYDDEHSADYRITVFDFPAVQRIDAELTFPEYTAVPTKRIEDTRQVSAVEGSTVTLICKLNKPVVAAWLSDESNERTNLELVEGVATEYRLAIPVVHTQRYAVHLRDAEGRANKLPPRFTITMLPNRPPELALKFPGRDTAASPLEELQLQATASDDFGLRAFGVTYSLGSDPPKSVALGANTAAHEKRDVEHVIKLEDLKAEPDQLLSYHVWAEDIGPDGQTRRAMSDMFFAEVRPFEEIFRQGEQPSESEMRQQNQNQQQGDGAARQAEQLAELQKKIITATWNLIRKPASATAAEKRAEEIGVVHESQQSAIEQAAGLGQQAQSDRAAEAVAEIVRHMTNAAEQLDRATKSTEPESLQAALAPEQAAYQALLKLRAREHEVIRGQRNQQGRQAGGGGGNRSQRQLNELELDAQENRYETQRTASPLGQQASREDNQVLNRLNELARRQSDLNQRIKELQSELQAADTEQKREELRRQLQRLRDEQQELVRDLDELRDRMDRPENQQRMAEARQDLDQTRSNMRKATESLEQGQLSQSVSSGTRAERELQEARDEFRRRTANQFSDEMRDMRDRARELAETERQLGEQLEQVNQSRRQSLRDDDRKNVREEISRQEERLKDLTQQMTDVSQQSETAEPLLSKQLYDTLREMRQRNLDQRMRMTGEMVQHGFLSEAAQAEQPLRQDIEDLNRRVDRAARSVLGDSTEAMRRALEEVEDLTRDLQKEIAQADPTPSDSQERPEDAQGQRSSVERSARPGGRADEQQRPRDDQGQPGDPGQSRDPNQPGEREGRSERGTRPNDSARPGNHENPESNRESSGQPPNNQQPGQRGGGRGQGQPNTPPSNAESHRAADSADRTGGRDRPQGGRATQDGSERFEVGGWTGPGGPITGERFREWSDRLRDVEEMLDDPELRQGVAAIRDRATGIRRDLKRHSQEPQWPLVRKLIAEPLVELQNRLREELARREPNDKLVPADRDPVPPRFSEQVRRYYERLGSGK